jgi:hypothetical protein
VAVAVISLLTLTVNASVVETNPLHVLAIAVGGEKINSAVKGQTKDMEKIAGHQAVMAGEFTQIKNWERKYNQYLTMTDGYAQAIKAGTMLYAEGVVMLREVYNLIKAVNANPQGIAATLVMNDLYIEVSIEMAKTYDSLKGVIAKGTNENMLTGAERTQLLWQLNDNMYALNKKLRQLALSIAYFNAADVWKKAIAGMVDRTHGEIAREAFENMKGRVKAGQIIS